MIELTIIDILYFMKSINSTVFLVIGMVCTFLGIIFTIIGTVKQSNENDKFQTEITESSNKNIELSEKLTAQNIDSTNKIVQLSDKNVELTLKLTEISEDRFKQLTQPVLNVINIQEIGNDLDSYFMIKVKNTGNNDCYNAKMIIDNHNSPLANCAFITSYTKVAKDQIVDYKIPVFITPSTGWFRTDKNNPDFIEFYNRYLNNKVVLVVHFHFEYEWNKFTLKSSQYDIIKQNKKNIILSSSEVMYKL